MVTENDDIRCSTMIIFKLNQIFHQPVINWKSKRWKQKIQNGAQRCSLATFQAHLVTTVRKLKPTKLTQYDFWAARHLELLSFISTKVKSFEKLRKLPCKNFLLFLRAHVIFLWTFWRQFVFRPHWSVHWGSQKLKVIRVTWGQILDFCLKIHLPNMSS